MGHRRRSPTPNIRRYAGMATRKPPVPQNVEGKLHIRAPWWRDQVTPFCYGRAMAVTGNFWPPGSRPTKKGSCSRCWGKWKAWCQANPGKQHPDGYLR